MSLWGKHPANANRLVPYHHHHRQRQLFCNPVVYAALKIIHGVNWQHPCVVILACENDSSALLVATVVRDYAPDVPIIACAALVENVGRIQQAGADFALSVGQVAGQLLAHHVLGQMVSQQARIKLAKLDAGPLIDHHPMEPRICELTGCSVIAIERADQVIMDIPPEFLLIDGDALYVCGTVDAFDHFYEQFTESRG